MKLTKSDLKAVVKECLVELLSEGIGGVSVQRQQPPQPRPQQAKRSFDPRLDSPATPPQKKVSTGNPIFDDILEDTARNTLPNMLKAEGSKQLPVTGRAEMLVESSTPEELFGDEAASKWAALAFSAAPKNA